MSLTDMSKVFSLYSGKRVFITGHTGFKGSWLVSTLNELGAKVMGYALKPMTNPNNFELINLENTIQNQFGDIRDFNKLSKALTDFKPEFVFHLAAQALVKVSYKEPLLTLDTNVMGSVNVLEAVRACGSVRAFIYVTSDKCYENIEWTWGYRENDKLGGHDPYSASKAAAELIFSSYYRSFFHSNKDIGAASVRAGNVIGGGDWASDRIIPDCIRSIKNNVPILLRNPKATRPWQHVLEPINGYLLLGAKLYENPELYSGPWNFGPNNSQSKTVEDVAKKITQYLGSGTIENLSINNLSHEANLLHLNCDKAFNLLGWLPKWDLEETLKATAQWYKSYLNNENLDVLTKKQIVNFFTELT